MGLFYNHRRNMSAEERAALRQIRQNRSKLYRNVRMAVILVTVLAIVFLTLAIAVADLRHPISFKLTFSILAVCLGGAACLPWITLLDRDKRRKAKGDAVPSWRFILTYAFFAFIGVCAVLWIIAVFVIGNGVLDALIEGQSEGIDPSAFTFLRVAIIVTLQALFGSIIATGFLRHGKNYFVLRIIMCVTIAYLDIWLSWVAGGITVNGIADGKFLPISNTVLWVLAVMTAAALLVCAFILNGQTRRKEIELYMKGDVSALTEGDVDLIDTKAATASMYRPEAPAAPAHGDQTASEKLRDLKKLLDDGIITQEEYDEKRKEIISKM